MRAIAKYKWTIPPSIFTHNWLEEVLPEHHTEVVSAIPGDVTWTLGPEPETILVEFELDDVNGFFHEYDGYIHLHYAKWNGAVAQFQTHSTGYFVDYQLKSITLTEF